MVVGEWTVALFTLIVSLVFFVQTFTFPHVNADPGGLALFPRIFSIFAGLSALFLMISLLKRSPKISYPCVSLNKLTTLCKKNTLNTTPVLVRNTIYSIMLCLIFPALMVMIGFLLSTIIFVFLLMKILGSRLLHSILYSVLLGGSLYYIFSVIIGVYLPMGQLWEYILN